MSGLQPEEEIKESHQEYIQIRKNGRYKYKSLFGKKEVAE